MDNVERINASMILIDRGMTHMLTSNSLKLVVNELFFGMIVVYTLHELGGIKNPGAWAMIKRSMEALGMHDTLTLLAQHAPRGAYG